jgi:hypothetical protein
LRGPWGSDTLARVLQRGLVESVDSSIHLEKLEEFSCPNFTFSIYFEQFTLCICFASICHNDLGFAYHFIAFYILASILGEVGLLFKVQSFARILEKPNSPPLGHHDPFSRHLLLQCHRPMLDIGSFYYFLCDIPTKDWCKAFE